MEYNDIKFEKRDSVAWITLNRPEKYNALRGQTLVELAAAFKDADRDRKIGVVVLTGAGDKAFCAGGDVSKLGSANDMDFTMSLDASTAMRNLAKPIIAAINGVCIGAGNELNCFSDLAIASERARFGQAGPKIGSAPVWGVTQMLPRLVGERKAREIVMLCRQYSALEAQEMGLVNKVVPHDQLYPEVELWCAELLDKSPMALGLAKCSLNFESDLMYPSYTHARQLINFVRDSPELKEGTTAFLEKRKPDWSKFRQ